MREHKYRAWHKTKHKMMLFELGELNDSMITKPEDGWYLEDCELMEWTGLVDKSKKDIYEGDIVVTENEDDYAGNNAPYQGTVAYDKDRGFYYIEQAHDTYRPLLGHLMIKSIEVIGNIHEHPELLEQSEGKQ